MENKHTNIFKEVFAFTGWSSARELAPAWSQSCGFKCVDTISEKVTMLVVGDVPKQEDLDFAAIHHITVIPDIWFFSYLMDGIDPRTNPDIDKCQPPLPPEPTPPLCDKSRRHNKTTKKKRHTPPLCDTSQNPQPPAEKKYPTYYENPFAHLKSAAVMIVATVILVFICTAGTHHDLIKETIRVILTAPIWTLPFCIWAMAHGIRTGDDPK